MTHFSIIPPVGTLSPGKFQTA